jgi:hypothetical protein
MEENGPDGLAELPVHFHFWRKYSCETIFTSSKTSPASSPDWSASFKARLPPRRSPPSRPAWSPGRPHADLSQAKIDLGVRLDALEAIIEKTGLADLATTLDQIAADQPEPGLRESIRETIAKATANVEAAKVTKARASRKPKGGQ